MEETVVARFESLARWNDVLKDHRPLRDHGHCRYVPAVSQVALIQIESAGRADYELGVRAYLVRPLPGDASRRLLRVVERSIGWRELGIVKQILRVVLALELVVHLVLVRIDLSLNETESTTFRTAVVSGIKIKSAYAWTGHLGFLDELTSLVKFEQPLNESE